MAGAAAGAPTAATDVELEQVAAVIDSQQRLRDRFLFAFSASTGMRVGQALGLRHEDVVSWERRIEVVPARAAAAAGRGRRAARRAGWVPVPGELIRLWSGYMHEEYGELESDFVFVSLWGGERGRPLAYSSVNELVRRTRELVGFHFTAHQYADLWVMPIRRGEMPMARSAVGSWA